VPFPKGGFPWGHECPSFFSIGKMANGTEVWAHKSSAGGKDVYVLGTYKYATEKRTFGTFTALNEDYAENDQKYKLDMGNYYASKDFYDPVKNRRIIWGWATVGDGDYQTLPRVITYDDELQMLSFAYAMRRPKRHRNLAGFCKLPNLHVNSPCEAFVVQDT